jgi:hypothetical protein
MSAESLSSAANCIAPALSERAAAERRGLLAVSTACIGIGWTGSIPSKISALGIDFSPSNKTGFLWVLAAIATYFLVAFVCYAVPDLLRLAAAWHAAKEQAEDTQLARSLGSDDDRINRWANDPDSRPILAEQFKREVVESRYRWRMLPGAVVDFAAPVAVAVVAVCSLVAARG